ncbi:Fe-S protein assembly co-chaperone HscB [Zooshikella ganghwensis]|uniref:Co-chaperone protein HscB homolog n=1 Tax=Zooshikella ganghwensis TaxID=202772 RepID=A0A4P9VIC3_9GAMM|nr:Fe-S protein assembly co-chaperone HscB [Zooshikella ganghwensis]RDH42968.1 Fe-S protein assembly co-chaperone HscB [Zooshikella ganghwensis]
MLELKQNYFELFTLAPSFNVDKAKLAEKYRALQRSFHPDNFAAESQQQQRLAVQCTAHINQAYQALRSDLLRAEYLLKLQGVDPQLDRTTVFDSEFLMEQMALREALEEVRSAVDTEVALQELQTTVDERLKDLFKAFSNLWDQKDPVALAQAVVVVQKLHFFSKLQQQVTELEAELLDDF